MGFSLQNIDQIGQAIAQIFHPFVEVVVHDLSKNKILSITSTSKVRGAGECSYLSKADRSLPDGIYGPYTKINEQGQTIKSISIVGAATLGGRENRIMTCINFDISEFQQVQTLMESLTSLSSMQPLGEIFQENWQDRIHRFTHEALREKGLSLNQLSREEKKSLVFSLRNQGAFQGKNAAAYIAQMLNVSRATIYGYLKEGE